MVYGSMRYRMGIANVPITYATERVKTVSTAWPWLYTEGLVSNDR